MNSSVKQYQLHINITYLLETIDFMLYCERLYWLTTVHIVIHLEFKLCDCGLVDE